MYFYFLISNHNNSIGEEPDWKDYYGRITNEHTTILDVEQPYIQPIERNNDFNINLSSIETKFSSIFRVELHSKNYSGFYFNKAAGIHQTSLVHCQQAFSNPEFQQIAKNLSVLQQFAKEVLKSPMVRLFSEENFTGHFENFHSGMEQGKRFCYNTRRLNRVKSAVTLGLCARLFDHKNCRVGRCLVEDFLRHENVSAVPDSFEISETTPYEIEDLSIPGLNLRYRLGHRKRIEGINAIVFQHGLVPAGKRFNDIGNAFNNSRYGTRSSCLTFKIKNLDQFNIEDFQYVSAGTSNRGHITFTNISTSASHGYKTFVSGPEPGPKYGALCVPVPEFCLYPKCTQNMDLYFDHAVPDEENFRMRLVKIIGMAEVSNRSSCFIVPIK
ncbi:unnamed protein product [Allacma fusca]|uniref:Uncharacterized protein n=1 Tax=Allacma fusca TaxID=39272 RepID=A0A8J2PQ60_9HEXA|nr:unnamed protein product [Allacma fusca]